jgi:hypothetical protein
LTWNTAPLVLTDKYYPAEGLVASLHFDPGSINLQLKATTQWNVDGDGSWSTPSNWQSSIVPDGPGAAALLGSKTAAPRTVTLDGPRSIGQLVFDSVNGYTIRPGTGGTLTVGDSLNKGLVLVARSKCRAAVFNAQRHQCASRKPALRRDRSASAHRWMSAKTTRECDDRWPASS